MIKSEAEYETALKQMERMMYEYFVPGSPEYDAVDILANNLMAYEEKHFPMK